MPIGGKEAFLSKVTFRRESKWYSKTKQMLNDMTIAERAKRNAVKAIEYACGRRVGEPEYITNLFIQMATEQKVIYDKRKDVLLQYLEELEAHYRDLGQYDDGKPIRRVIEYIKEMEE